MEEVINGWTVVIKRAASVRGGGEFIAVGDPGKSVGSLLFLKTRREARQWLRELQSGKHKFDARIERARVTFQTYQERGSR